MWLRWHVGLNLLNWVSFQCLNICLFSFSFLSVFQFAVEVETNRWSGGGFQCSLLRWLVHRFQCVGGSKRPERNRLVGIVRVDLAERENEQPRSKRDQVNLGVWTVVAWVSTSASVSIRRWSHSNRHCRLYTLFCLYLTQVVACKSKQHRMFWVGYKVKVRVHITVEVSSTMWVTYRMFRLLWG